MLQQAAGLGDQIRIDQCLCLPKAELNTKNLTKRQPSFGWVFGVQLDFLEKSVSGNAENRVDFIPTFLAT